MLKGIFKIFLREILPLNLKSKSEAQCTGVMNLNAQGTYQKCSSLLFCFSSHSQHLHSSTSVDNYLPFCHFAILTFCNLVRKSWQHFNHLTLWFCPFILHSVGRPLDLFACQSVCLPSIPNPSSTSPATLVLSDHLLSLTHAFLFAIGFLMVRTFFLLVWEMPGCSPFLSNSAEVSHQLIRMGKLTAREVIIVRKVSLWCETGRQISQGFCEIAPKLQFHPKQQDQFLPPRLQQPQGMHITDSWVSVSGWQSNDFTEQNVRIKGWQMQLLRADSMRFQSLE